MPTVQALRLELSTTNSVESLASIQSSAATTLWAHLPSSDCKGGMPTHVMRAGSSTMTSSQTSSESAVLASASSPASPISSEPAASCKSLVEDSSFRASSAVSPRVEDPAESSRRKKTLPCTTSSCASGRLQPWKGVGGAVLNCDIGVEQRRSSSLLGPIAFAGDGFACGSSPWRWRTSFRSIVCVLGRQVGRPGGGARVGA
mmetsp:Transcript_40517/g.120120  ORF Transcript_40517/g.120120 Transcript_40517/m.120120 type:complete len:202 (+) Transcript_40517:765-1370(+)